MRVNRKLFQCWRERLRRSPVFAFKTKLVSVLKIMDILIVLCFLSFSVFVAALEQTQYEILQQKVTDTKQRSIDGK